MQEEKQGPLLFLLGAGASVDSGYPVYRGVGGIYSDVQLEDPTQNIMHVSGLFVAERRKQMWESLNTIMSGRGDATLGSTYQKIAELCCTYNSGPTDGRHMIVTQNVDGLATKLDHLADIVELHGDAKQLKCMSSSCGHIGQCSYDEGLEEIPPCTLCGATTRPNILLFGEQLGDDLQARIHTHINRHRPKKVYVIGSTMQFPYLHMILNKAKSKGATVIHVNPDPNYDAHLLRLKLKSSPTPAGGEYRPVMVRRKRPDALLMPEQFLEEE